MTNVFTRRSVRSVALRTIAAAAALAAAFLAVMGSEGGRNLGNPERSSFKGGAGYWLLAKDGGVFAFGDARFFGPNRNQGHDIAGMAATATGNGYWTVDDDGDVFPYGDAVDYGSRPGPEVDNITGFAARTQGDGYWMVARDGSVYAFGAAAYFGSANTVPLVRPIVGMAATPSGKGYWLIAGDGGVFAYGDAKFFGSTGNIRLARPIVDFASTSDAQGYRFVGSDGGVFAYGKAGFFGSTGAIRLNQPVVGFAGTASGHGYWLVGEDGGVFAFGDAQFHGSTGGMKLNAAIVAIVPTPRVKVDPTARADTATVAEDGSAAIDVRANDSHLLPASVSVESAPTQGTAAVSAGKIVYTPKANFNGSDSFKYKLTDSAGHSSTATVSVTVTPVNDAPTISNVLNQATMEDTPTGAVPFSVSDIDSGALQVSAASSNTTLIPNGNLALGGSSGARTVTATPAPDQNGTSTITLTVSDGSLSSSDTFPLTVTAVNDAPVAASASLTTPVGTPLSSSVSATDAEGDPLTFDVVTAPTNGILALAADGTFTYTPGALYHGLDSFEFKAHDGDEDSNSATTTIAVNSAPVAASGSAFTDEDVPVGGSVAAADTDVDPLTYSKVDDPVHGTVTVDADGTFTYTPAADYHGSDSFTFKANDGFADSNPATITITVNPVNDAPVAEPQSASTTEDTPLNGAVSAIDVEGSPLIYAKVADPDHGTVTVSADGTFTYTPAADFHGSDSFTFNANDGTADSNTATVSVTVTAVNDAPVATPASGWTAEDTPLAGSLAGTDVENDPLSFVKVTDPAQGTVTVEADGTFTYTPAADYNGGDSFTFQAHDGTSDSNTVTFSITVVAVNDAPVAEDGSDTTPVLTPVEGSVTAVDVDGDALDYSLVSGPSNGALLLNGDGTFTYTPFLLFAGEDSFTFKANDGSLDSNTAAFTITVVNTPPVAVDDTGTTVAGTVVIDVLANDSDGDLLDTLTVTVDVNVTDNGGTVSCVAGECTYVASVTFHGEDSFTYTVTDGFGSTDEATVTITVP